MFPDFSQDLNRMCGALPVSAEDVPGLAEAVERIHERYAEQLSRDLIEQARSEAVGG
jgi:gamma-glutamyltranspeptidase